MANGRTRRVIHIEPTDEQWAALDHIYGGYTPFVAVITDEHGQPSGSLYAERIVDDNEIQLYTIAPDGSYTYEELEGLGYGWTKYDEGGEEIKDEDDEEEDA